MKKLKKEKFHVNSSGKQSKNFLRLLARRLSCGSHLSEKGKLCSPRCKFFTCVKHAMVRHSSIVYCKWTGDECIGPACNYASCSRHMLLSNGTCGLTIKRRGTVEERMPEEGIPERIRTKILRRIKDEGLI